MVHRIAYYLGNGPLNGVSGLESTWLLRLIPGLYDLPRVDVDDREDVTRVLDASDAPTSDTNPPTSARELPEGATFGRYVVARKLGSGGMGVVYLAYDPQLDRGVALKVLHLHTHAEDDSMAQDRLIREAQAMARLSHPNVVPVFDVGTVQSHVFVAMEHIEGRTLGEWLDQEQPRWSTVLDVFLGAGRGLAAAHAAGLVHRDFKPDNVMIDREGRARVMDFGLARAPEDELDRDEISEAVPDLAAASGARLGSSSSMSGSLTRTGVVLGTPAYMAPEQHMGQAIDPASDQFSFCVTLYRGLYGERPFVGNTGLELCKAALEGTLQSAPAGSRVPKWLRRMVIRGLAADPEHRWPSMQALLDALTRRRGRAQRLRTGVPAALVLSVAVGGSMWWQGQREAPCQASETALAEVWGDDQREAMTRSFVATELVFAEGAAERAAEHIDQWSVGWVEQHRDACEATHLRHEQSETGLDQRMRCLQGRRRALEGLLSVFDSAEASTVERSINAIEALPKPVQCGDLEALSSQVALPEDPALRKAVEDQHAALNRVDSLLAAARFTEGRTAIDEIEAASSELQHAPLHVEINARQAAVLEKEGKLDEAARTLEATLWGAEAQGMDRMVLLMATKLLWLEGVKQDLHDRATTWSTLADAKLDRLGEAPRMRANLRRMQGGLADAKGEYEQAAGLFAEALGYWEAVDPKSVGHAQALGDFGKIHYRAGRAAEAAETFEQAAIALSEALGPWHPDVGKAWGNVAAARHGVGDYRGARDSLEASLEVLERAYGPDHIALATALTNLGSVYYRLEDYDKAIESGRRSIRIKEAVLGAGHPKTGLNLNNIALVLSEQGHHEQALETYHQAVASMVSLGPEYVAVIEPLIGTGEELMHLRRHAEATAPLERAYALQKSHEPRTRLALPAFLLARALWEGGGDRERARALTLEALDALGEPKTPDHEKLSKALHVWIEEHPG